MKRQMKKLFSCTFIGMNGAPSSSLTVIHPRLKHTATLVWAFKERYGRPLLYSYITKPIMICGLIEAEDAGIGWGGAPSSPSSSSLDLQPFNMTLTPVAARSAISIDLSATY